MPVGACEAAAPVQLTLAVHAAICDKPPPSIMNGPMELPSPALQSLLSQLELGGAGRLRAASRQVRRMANDLPIFDSVWIDAYLRSGVITAFQAEQLHAGQGSQLCPGRYVLLKPLGQGSKTSTFLASSCAEGSRGPRRLSVIKILPAEPMPGTLDRLGRLIADAAEIRTVRCAAPTGLESSNGPVIVQMPFIAGESASQRLIRQGRFPAPAVVQIAKQLLQSLAAAAECSLPHGDLRAENVILTPSGEAVPVAWGLRLALHPVLTIQERRPPEWYEGSAPERIGSGAKGTLAADAYALACLLWQLLAGRPAFPQGDGLGKLAAHAARALPPIDDFAPDCPAVLKTIIFEMGDRDPDKRLVDFAAAFTQLKAGGNRHLVARGHRTPESGSSTNILKPIALTAAMLAAGFFLYQDDWQRKPLNAEVETANPTPTRQTVASAQSVPTSSSLFSVEALPAPNAQGTIELSGGIYEAKEILRRGTLEIRGMAATPATIVVRDQLLRLSSDQIHLKNVVIRSESSSSFVNQPPALLLCECQNLHLEGCDFEGRTGLTHGSAIGWRILDSLDPTAGQLLIEQCTIRDVGQALSCSSPPRQITVRQTLVKSCASLLTLRQLHPSPLVVHLADSTCRNLQTVVAIGHGAEGAACEMVASDTVLALPDSAALFTVTTQAAATRLSWSGTGTVTNTENLRPVALMTAERTLIAVPENCRAANPAIEGIVRAAIEFSGPAEGTNADCRVFVSGVPRRPGSQIGAQLSRSASLLQTVSQKAIATP